MLRWIRLPESTFPQRLSALSPAPIQPVIADSDFQPRIEFVVSESGTVVDGVIFREYQGPRAMHNGALWCSFTNGKDLNLFLLREVARDGSLGWVIGQYGGSTPEPSVLFGAACTNEVIEGTKSIIPPRSGWYMFPSCASPSQKIQPKLSSLKIVHRISDQSHVYL